MVRFRRPASKLVRRPKRTAPILPRLKFKHLVLKPSPKTAYRTYSVRVRRPSSKPLRRPQRVASGLPAFNTAFKTSRRRTMLPKTAFKSNGTNTPALKLSDVYEHSGVDMTGRRKRASNYDNETVYWYIYICPFLCTHIHL